MQTWVSSEWAVSGPAGSATPGSENPGQTILCDPVCGNGFTEAGEVCDDGNDDDFDLCLSTCQPAELPTLDGWGLLGLVLLLTTAGSAALRRSRRLEGHAPRG